MGKIFQLRAKKKINSKIDKGFVLTVPSNFSSQPIAKEITDTLEKQFGKDAAAFAGQLSNWDIIS